MQTLELPNELDFGITCESTGVEGQKLLRNSNTNTPIWYVGKSLAQGVVSHPEFYSKSYKTVQEDIPEEYQKDSWYEFRSANGGTWSTMTIHFPSIKADINTNSPQGHDTTVYLRGILTHGLIGNLSNAFYWGLIDMFCTNGWIMGDWKSVKKKNTSGFKILNFNDLCREVKVDFFKETDRLQAWSKTLVQDFNVKEAFEKIMSEKKAENMYLLYLQEAGVRGRNMFAVQSALTNFATYADERNGFKLRNTQHMQDTQDRSMWSRQLEVNKWMSSGPIQDLAGSGIQA